MSEKWTKADSEELRKLVEKTTHLIWESKDDLFEDFRYYGTRLLDHVAALEAENEKLSNELGYIKRGCKCPPLGRHVSCPVHVCNDVAHSVLGREIEICNSYIEKFRKVVEAGKDLKYALDLKIKMEGRGGKHGKIEEALSWRENDQIAHRAATEAMSKYGKALSELEGDDAK